MTSHRKQHPPTEDTQDPRDHDSPWKEALDHYFAEFTALFFPDIHQRIDWSHPYRALDKELQKILRQAKSGRRYADKLYEVRTTDGEIAWVLIHIEVQGEPEDAFPFRMFQYHVRIRERYQLPVVSLAVLTDTNPRFRPDRFTDERWGCSLEFRFPMVKLLDWTAPERWKQLETSDNLFALVAMAQILAKSEQDGHRLKHWKFKLMRLMYDRGHGRDTILELLRIIDWMIRLPPELEAAFNDELRAYEESKQMPYITSFERIGMKKGYQQGEAHLLLKQLATKFGTDAAEAWREQVQAAAPETLETWSERILSAETPEAIFH